MKLHLIFLLTLCFSFAGLLPLRAENVPYTTESPIVGDPITGELVSRFAAAALGEKAVFAIVVKDADTGVPYAQINAARSVKPASLMKLVTAAAALDVLGRDYQFTTTLEGAAPDKKGVVAGPLVIRGGGDPSLGPRFQADTSNITGVLDDWAAQLSKRGVKRIEGNIVGNDLRYDGVALAVGWEPLELAQWYSAEVSALNFNENTVDVDWRAGKKAGDDANFVIKPSTKYVKLQSSVRNGPASQVKPRIRYFRFPDSNDVRARGTLPPDTSKYDFVTIHDPAKFTAQLTLDALKRRGIFVKGGAVSQRAVGADFEPTNTITLITRKSPTIAQMLPTVIGISHNLYAEVFLREIALSSNQPASFDGGYQAINAWLREHQLQRNGFAMVDGSGLSTIDRASAGQLVDILRYVYGTTNRDLFFNSLATPGKLSLKGRMETEEYKSLQDNLRAKTGFVSGSHGLAGLFKNAAGNEYAFAIIVNDYDPDRTVAARDFVDQAILYLQSSPVLP